MRNIIDVWQSGSNQDVVFARGWIVVLFLMLDLLGVHEFQILFRRTFLLFLLLFWLALLGLFGLLGFFFSLLFLLFFGQLLSFGIFFLLLLSELLFLELLGCEFSFLLGWTCGLLLILLHDNSL